jgi:cytoskeletal protein CcmA (bactofilin family)
MQPKDLTGIGEIHALLGRGTEFEGKLTFDGRVRIDGTFRGEIWSDGMLVFGDGAKIDAKIEVGTLIVRGGELRGEVKATELVELHAPAHVLCDIDAPQLFIDKGVHFEGRCTMANAEVHEIDEAPEEVMEAEPEEADSDADSEAEADADAGEDAEAGEDAKEGP